MSHCWHLWRYNTSVSEFQFRRRTVGVIFDLDGVLLDSLPSHEQAFREILRPLGISNFSYADFMGWRTADVFRAVLTDAGMNTAEETLAQYSSGKTALVRALLQERSEIFTAAVPVVSELASTYPLALASSGSRGNVETFLDQSGLRTAFRSVVSGDDVVKAKPDPEIFQKAIQSLNLAPAQCVVVEDAEAGVQAACAAGAVACGFGNDSSGKLQRAGARLSVASLAELPQVLESFRPN